MRDIFERPFQPMRAGAICASFAASLVLTVACSGERDADTNGGTSGQTSGGMEDDGSTTLSKLDLGDGNDGPGDLGGDACKKIDLLFVIDSSGSMADEQENLISSFPSFIEEIRSQLSETKGYHVGVVSSDDGGYFMNSGNCSRTGGLVTGTERHGACEIGGNYMTQDDDLEGKFGCVAEVGTNGSGDEKTMEAAVSALNLGGGGECNEGFIRDDAILVLVLITDEEDDHESEDPDNPAHCYQPGAPLPDGSRGDPPDWIDDVLAVKQREKNVVVLSLVGPPGPEPGECPLLDKCNGNAIDGAEVGNRIVEFTEHFSFGVVGRVCESSYRDFFVEAVGQIKSACDEFIPVE